MSRSGRSHTQFLLMQFNAKAIDIIGLDAVNNENEGVMCVKFK